MADEKEIAKLQFDISKAEGQLDTLNDKLKKLALNSNVSSNKNDFSKLINFDKIKKEFDTLEKLGKNKTANIANYAIKSDISVSATRQKESEKRKTIIQDEERIEKKATADIEKFWQKKSASVAETEEKEAIKYDYWLKKKEASTKSVTEKIANMANTYLVTRGLNELRQAVSDVIKEMTEVQYSMVEIDRVLNENSLNIDIYRDKLIQLAYDYGNSFDNVADVTLRLAQAGFDSTETLKLTESTLLALNTAELDATQATEDMIAVMSQWGLMTGDATQEGQDYAAIIDKINKVADNFPTTSADILEALKKTSSAFNLAGASIDETIAMIVTAEIASQRGGKAIGTAMNNIVQQMKNTNRLATMESLGIEIYTDATRSEFNSVIDIITQLSEKMQQLKKDGRENSQEMQDLLEVFTLFRRNVGAGLLSGVAGEDSNYAKVLETSMNSLGYSLQENEKHMRTAKAAQEQFNTTLLQLKTAVWDNGAEDVFRALLLLGSDIAKVFTALVKVFGTVPTAVGLVTLAFTTFSKSLKVATIQTDKATGAITGVVANSKTASGAITLLNNAYKAGTISATTLTAATAALQVVMSLGLSAAITAVLGLFNHFIHAEEEARRKTEELVQSYTDEIQKSREKIDTINQLIGAYEKLANVGPLSLDQQQELEAYQKSITDYLISQNKYTAEMAGNYKLQLETIKEIRKEEIDRQLEQSKLKLQEQEKLKTGLSKKDISGGFWNSLWDDTLYQLNEAKIQTEEVVGEIYPSLNRLANLSFDEQVETLTKWKEQLEETGYVGTDVYTWVIDKLEILRGQTEQLTEAQKEYYEAVLENEKAKLLSENDVEDLEDYQELLEKISEVEPPDEWAENVEDFRASLEALISEDFPEFQEQLEASNGNFSSLNSILSNTLEQLDSYAGKYQTLESAVEEFNTAGQITSETLKSLVDNNLLGYLDLTAEKASINSEEFLNLGEALKVQAIQALQAAAADDIQKVALGDIESISPIAKAAIADFGDEAVKTRDKAASSVDAIESMAKALQDVHDAASGNLGKGVSSSNFEKQSKAIISSYTKYAEQISKLDISSPLYGKKSGGSRSSGGGSGGGGSAKQATKTFEQESQERVKIFKEEINKLISLEEDWVKKYKKLNLLSTSDLMFIQHQRINKYGDILNQINGLTGISEKDRASLIQEYSKQRQEAEFEYFDLLKQKLDDQIKELQDANKKRIDAIEEAADAQIDALNRVEDENDRIRQKEEYERKRNELIYGHQGIEYWRQRTGRDAQLALQDAEAKLKDLDDDWEEKKKGWTLDDQIEQIEKARDAQIKAIEDAEEKQIEGWKNAYNEQVRLYAETGQIIYDDSVITAGYLYNAYMDNFVNPLQSQLQHVIASLNTANATATEVANKVGSGGGGSRSGGSGAGSSADVSSSSLVQRAINSATNAVKQGQKPLAKAAVGAGVSALKKVLGKFHGGGEVGSSTEAIAILRPKEVVLTPEWAAGMNKLVRQINEGKMVGGGTNTNIDVQGNLINMDGVKINDRRDADYLTERIEKVFRDKFNVRK